MRTTVVKWGNSQGIRIPKALLQNINIAENEVVDLLLEGEKIVIKKAGFKPHKTAKERLVAFYGADYDKNSLPQREIDWGKPEGKELW